MRRDRFFVSVVLLLAAAVLTACGGSDEADDATATSASSESAEGPVVNTVDGGQFDFNDLKGQPALLWFWAPW